MKNFFATLWTGMQDKEPCGNHPGTPVLILLVMLGAALGGWTGMLMMFSLGVIPFLIGCWERGKIMEWHLEHKKNKEMEANK